MRVVALVLMIALLQGCGSVVQNRELMVSKQYYRDGDYKSAYRKLLPLASEGNPKAEYAIGYLYYYGYGVPQDTETGRFWIQKSAAQHYVPAEKALEMLNVTSKTA